MKVYLSSVYKLKWRLLQGLVVGSNHIVIHPACSFLYCLKLEGSFRFRDCSLKRQD